MRQPQGNDGGRSPGPSLRLQGREPRDSSAARTLLGQELGGSSQGKASETLG